MTFSWKITLTLLLVFVLGLLIRFYGLGTTPASIYWDEASIGYNAYSIATMGRDEYGQFFPLDKFVAFGDYKAPGYIYAAAASVKTFGLSEFSVRLPSALFGALLIIVSYFLSRELIFLSSSQWLKNARNKISLASAFVVAVSPWATHFSHVAFESNLATFFSALGFTLLLFALRNKSFIWFVLSSPFLLGSVYTFNSHRYFVPVFALLIIFVFARQILSIKKLILAFVAFAVVSFSLSIPLIPHLLSREGSFRFNEVTWLNDLAPIEKSNEYIKDDGGGVIANFVHNRRLFYLNEFAKHFTDQFNWQFLFISGDVNPRLSSQDTGEFYFFEAIFLIGGVYFLAKDRSKASLIAFSWVLLGIIPAALARETPHALRIYDIAPVPQIIVAIGLIGICQSIIKRKKIIGIASIAIGYFVVTAFHFHYYFTHFSKDYSQEWQYGYKNLVEYVSSVQANYDLIKVTDSYERPYIYFLFYQKYNPVKYWSNSAIDRDWYGLRTVKSFDKFTFGDTSKVVGKKVLYVVQAGKGHDNAKPIKSIADLEGKPIFDIFNQ